MREIITPGRGARDQGRQPILQRLERKRSSCCERTLGNLSAQRPWLESRSRYYVHSAFTASLAAANDFAHAGDANRLAWSDLLPSETRWLGRETFFHLEVPHHEVERGDTNSRALFREFDAG